MSSPDAVPRPPASWAPPAGTPTAAPRPAVPAPPGAPAAAGPAPTAARTAAAAPTRTAAGQAAAGVIGQGSTAAWTVPRAASAAVSAAAAAPPDGPPLAARTPTPPSRPPVRRPDVRRRVPGGAATGQLLAVQGAVAAVLAVHRQPPAVLVPVAAVALVVVLLAVVRLRGRWAWQWADLWLRHRFGRRRSVLLPVGDPAATADALLDAVADGAWLDRVELDGGTAALWTSAGGLAVAVEVSPAGPLPFVSARRELPALTQLLPAADEGGARFTVQVLEQTLVPSRAAQDPASLSYQELTGGSVPAQRRCWVALQVLRTPADDDPDTLRTDLVNATRRVLRRLRRDGLRAVPVGPDDAVLGVLGLLGPDAGPLPHRVTDGWRHWQAGPRRWQTASLDLGGDVDPAAVLTRARDGAGRAGVATTITVAARRPDESSLELQAVVRTALADGDDPATVAAAFASAGVPLGRLDGRQAAGVAATLPLGGFLR
ncbi:hypothetical protein [Blastococcus sp. TF02A-26]|uniref:hypothetical protein n=1 Tax=Blastococcus sp. TF02A-26 TaxID=2250577 RepID=UPI000DE9C147|nr:hypothetical protein [Blastococcus sp. TF02A-26]